MVYLYALLGVTMMSGIMAIFEMGLLLTGQSMLPTPADVYLANSSVKERDKTRLEFLLDQKDACVENCGDVAERVMKSFSELVEDDGLCGALNRIDDIDEGDVPKWALISEGRWSNSCQLSLGSHRAVVKKNSDARLVPYQLFSCDLEGENTWYDNKLGIYRCSFEYEAERS